MNMNSFVKKWDGKGIQDDGPVTSDEFKEFAKDFKGVLKDMCQRNGWSLEDFSKGHYDISGFLSRPMNNGSKAYIYYNFNVPRGEFPLSLRTEQFRQALLYRTAKNIHDYTGGSNSYCAVADMEDWIQTKFGRIERMEGVEPRSL